MSGNNPGENWIIKKIIKLKDEINIKGLILFILGNIQLKFTTYLSKFFQKKDRLLKFYLILISEIQLFISSLYFLITSG